ETLKYQAVALGKVDVLDVYTTDGRLLQGNFRVLRDDRQFFPPYEAAPLVRGAALRAHPEIATVLSLLAGAFDDAAMRKLNLRLRVEKADVPTAARQALADLGLLTPDRAPAAPSQGRAEEGLGHTLWTNRVALAHQTAVHLGLSGVALLLGILVAVPLGLW